MPSAGAPARIDLLDLRTNKVRTFAGGALRSVPEVLTAYDVIAGCNVRDTLRALGIDWNRYHATDLMPRAKHVDVDGRAEVTIEAIIEGTLRVPGVVFYDNDAQRAMSALAALYRYIVLHDAVVMRIEDVMGVLIFMGVRIEGDLSLHVLLDDASKSGRSLDLVVGAAPELGSSPAKRVRGTVIEHNADEVVVRAGGSEVLIDRIAIQSASFAPTDDVWS